MAAFLERPSRIKLLLAFRGSSKSTLTIWYAAWRLLRLPSTRIHFVSHADHQAASLAEKLLDFLRTSPVCKHLAPGKGISKSNYQVALATVERDKSVSCSGIKGSRTGIRSDLIIADDIETRENGATASLREDLLNAMGEFPKLLHEQLRLLKGKVPDSALVGLPEHAQIVYLGTYQSCDSIYILPEQTGEEGHPLRLADIAKFSALKDGVSVFPEKYSTTDLDFKKATDSTQNWNLHYLLDPTPLSNDLNPVKVERIAKYPMTPKVLVCYIDPTGDSLRKKQWDEFAVLFGGPAEGRLYISDLLGWKSEDSFASYRRVIRECLDRDVHRIMIEGQQPTQAQVLRQVLSQMSSEEQKNGRAPIRIQVEPFGIGNANKEMRVVETLEVSVNTGNLVMHPRVLLDARTREQFQKIRANALPDPCDRVDLCASFVSLNSSRIAGTYKFQAFKTAS